MGRHGEEEVKMGTWGGERGKTIVLKFSEQSERSWKEGEVVV